MMAGAPPKLPLELIPCIFQAFEDEHGGPQTFDDADEEDSLEEYRAFFRTMALVCKDWYKLTSTHGRTLHLHIGRTAKMLSRSMQEGAIITVEHLSVGYQIVSIAANDPAYAALHLITTIELATITKNVRSLALPWELLRDLPVTEQETWHTAASNASFLYLYAAHNSQPEMEFEWQKATYLHNNTTLQHLSLVELDIVLDSASQADKIKACFCKSLKLQDTSFGQRVSYATLFPNIEHLSLIQRESWMDASRLDLQHYSDKLTSLEIENHWFSNNKAVHEAESILYSPNLISVHLTLSTHQTLQTDLIYCPAIFYVEFLGDAIKSVKHLTLIVSYDEGHSPNLVDCCSKFSSPSYFQNLQDLPSIISPENANTHLTADDRAAIREGLEGLRARGIAIDEAQIAKTMWRYALR